MRASCGRTKRPRGALLHLVAVAGDRLRSLGGSRRTSPCGGWGGNRERPLWRWSATHARRGGGRTTAGGEFDWGGRLPKGNGGAQWFPQRGWYRALACKGIRELDCEADGPSRWETRA